MSEYDYWHEFQQVIESIEVEIHANAVKKGFWESISPALSPMQKANKIALMHSELSETLEAVRKPHPDEHLPIFSNEVVELADCVIRILDYCHHYNLPLAQAIMQKVQFNTGRPYKHGKEF